MAALIPVLPGIPRAFPVASIFVFVETPICGPLRPMALRTSAVNGRGHTGSGGCVGCSVADPPLCFHAESREGGLRALLPFSLEQSLGEGVPQRRMVPASRPCSPSRTRMIRQSAGMSWFSSMRIPELPCSCPRGRCGPVPPLILSLWFLR